MILSLSIINCVLLGIKKIDKLVIGGFIGPYFLSFFVAEFVLIMQFLWKFVDKIIGKGISFFQIMELLFFVSVKLVPMAIPLTILISSVMVFGNMAERYELTSIKSAGVSLLRIMRPGVFIAISTALFSILCSNYLVPKANFEFQSRFAKIKRTKPTLNFEDGIFNDDFKGFEIRIDKKGADGKTIEGIIIEDHTSSDPNLINVIVADHGEMFVTSDGNYFVMNLFEGVHYKELKTNKTSSKDDKNKKKFPFMRTHFKEWTKVFDMSGFSFNEDLFELNRNKYDLLNTVQLITGIDSLNNRKKEKIDANHVMRTNESRRKKNKKKTNNKTSIADKATNNNSKSNSNSKQQSTIDKGKIVQPKKKPTTPNKSRKKKGRTVPIKIFKQIENIDLSEVESILYTFKGKDKLSVLNNTHARVSVQKDRTKRSQTSVKSYEREKQKYIYKLNEAYSWALVCIIFLFIGAPLGSIIRKGGYGYPLLFAIVFYMIFMILVIFGQKLVKTQALNPILAAWLPCFVLLPVCLYLTVMAINDAKSLDWRSIGKSISKKLFRVD